MKAISLWQPWASLLVTGRKRCETRGWPTSHRGLLLVHAAKAWNMGLAMYAFASPFREALQASGIVFAADEDEARRAWGMPLGAVVGRVDVVDCIPTELCHQAEPGSSPDMPPLRITSAPGRHLLLLGENERAFGDFSPRRFAFVCEKSVRFAEPVPYRGRQGLFEVPDSIIPAEYRA